MTKAHTLEVTKDVEWIGILDPDLDVFDIIMETKYGTTYNSFFINAEKKTIIETSKEGFQDEYLEKVKSVCNPAEIEYIILNHTEPDHSGNLKYLLEIAPNATVVASGNALKYLPDIVGKEFKSLRAKDGETLDLGNKTIHFIAAPNLHWPDTIYSYLVEDKLLFTCDSFGSHFCDARMFDDEVDNFDEAYKYYFDVILKPFSKFMLKAIDKIKDLDIKMICPGHGPILRSYWEKYVAIAAEYAQQEIENREREGFQVFIPYVSAYGYTKKIAEAIAEGVKEVANVSVELCDIQDKDFHFLDHKIAGSKALIIGSPTINQNILPQIYQLFASINPIRDRGKAYAAFGSFGWSGEGVGIIENALSTLKLVKLQEGMKVKFSPKIYNPELKEFGKRFGESLTQ
ncbi:MAG: FprA family A-type flavoprotein [Bacteroidetes bacterium]|nr:FprA family A-type flavoprotein [Bacteroidota bacterium]